MFKIQVLNAISPAGLSQFPSGLYQIEETIENPDAILVRSQDMHKLTIPDSVKAIARAGAGVNNIPVVELTQRGIPVFNTPGANANAVRELVIAGMLLCSRNICQAWSYVKHLEGSDAELSKTIEQNKKQFAGFELMGKTLGVVGLGSVGVKVANAAINLGMTVIGYDPTISVNRAWELSASVTQAKSLNELLKQADFVTIHVPLIDETKNMISVQQLQEMKMGVVVLNFARDEIVDHQAMKSALNADKVYAYVTDFPSAELKDLPRVISLPHLGASTKEAEENCAVMAVKQMKDFLETGAIVNSVNFPTLEVGPLSSGARVSVMNANVPNMVAQISGALAKAGLNIVSLANKSRDEVAYTVIDVDGKVGVEVACEIEKIKGVLQVRIMGA